jgi:hypothetical protein
MCRELLSMTLSESSLYRYMGYRDNICQGYQHISKKKENVAITTINRWRQQKYGGSSLCRLKKLLINISASVYYAYLVPP